MYDNMNKEQEEILEDFESVVKDELTCNLKTTNWYLDYTDNLIQNYSDVFGTIKLYILTASSSPEIKDQIIGLVVFAVVPINLTQSEIKEMIDDRHDIILIFFIVGFLFLSSIFIIYTLKRNI